MRHDTDPKLTTTPRGAASRPVAARADGWDPGLAERTETGTDAARAADASRAPGSDCVDCAVDADHAVLTASAVGTARAAGATDGGIASWQEIKSRFVDDPAGAIAAAEDLVRRAVDERVRVLQEEATAICAGDRGDDATSTETLRTRLLNYQQYCERLTRDAVH